MSGLSPAGDGPGVDRDSTGITAALELNHPLLPKPFTAEQMLAAVHQLIHSPKAS